jgi:subtilase family serine protease
MIRRFSTVLLTIVALVALAGICSAQGVMTHHLPEAVLTGRSPLVGHLPANQSMRLVLVLPIRDQAGLDNFLKDVYDQNSPSYRKFLTVEQFTEKFGPTQDDYSKLIQFAKDNGFTVVKQSRNRLNLDVVGSVAAIEKTFHVSMNIYQHDTEARTFFSPDREPTTDLSLNLWRVAGLDNYATPHPMYTRRVSSQASADVKSNATTGSGPDASFLGSDMRAAYYSAEGGTLTGTGQTLGLFEYIGTDLTDLDDYYTNVSQTNNVPITLTSVDTQSTSCLYKNGCDDTEQTIDMTQSLGMAPGMAGLTMWIGTGGLSGQTLDDAGILNGMATANPLNAQLSCSWGWKPDDPSTDDPYFEEFAAQGQNFFVASGDDGKWSKSGYPYPAEDVYVTTVGGTDLDTASAAGPWASETGWEDTGGGISPDDFAIPSWQVAAAAGCAKCSQTYRNGPDVSANANFTFYVCADQGSNPYFDGQECGANIYGGTSFATPMWAGYLALTNQQYLANGNATTLGFINPALYDIYAGSSYDTDFHDITSGGNSYGSTVGYDLSTGLGSPNGPALLSALAGAPAAGFSVSANPNAVTVAQGDSATSTITTSVTGGFDSSIALTASGQPTGVTVSFNPTSVTGAGTSTMTMAVASTVAAGTYSITVTGTSGSITETTTVSLTVTAVTKGSFSLTTAPSSITIAPGGTGKVKLTSTVSGGFDSAISLSASGEASNVKVSISPTTIAAPGSGHAAIEIKVAPGAKAGTQTITITGTGGGVTATATITVTIS